MYHRIANDPFDPWGTAVTPDRFQEHLAWLISYRTVLPLAEFASRLAEQKLPANAAAVTFDDGYSCNADCAAPLLERFKVPATFFLAVEQVESGARFWWDELEDIVFEHDGSSLSLEDASFELGPKRVADRRWRPNAPPATPRQKAYHALQRLLVTKKPADLRQAILELSRQAGRPNSGDGKRAMNPKQVRKIKSGLIEFGSHSLSHAWLTSLSPAEQKNEIGGSVERCRALTGSAPASLAYPFGAFDEHSARVAEEAGFQCACSTENKPVEADSPIFELPRIQAGNWSGRKLARVLREL